MNHVLIIAHQPLAEALRQCALHVFPEEGERITALDVPAQEAPEVTLERMCSVLRAQGSTLVLTDMLGATPSNVMTKALAACNSDQVRAVVGVNMPMVVRAMAYAHLPLSEMQARALQGGKDSMMLWE